MSSTEGARERLFRPRSQSSLNWYSEDQEVLQSLHDELLRMLPGEDLAPKFYSDKLMTESEYDAFKEKMKTHHERNQHLLACVSRRPRPVESLISCLQKHTDLAGITEVIIMLEEEAEKTKHASTLSHSGSTTSLFAGFQDSKRSAEVPDFAVFENIINENKMLKDQNERLQQSLKKLERFKKNVAKLVFEHDNEDLEGTTDRSADNTERRNRKQKCTSYPQQESEIGWNQASEYAYGSSRASSVASIHTSDAVEEDRVPTPVQHISQPLHTLHKHSSLYESTQDLEHPPQPPAVPVDDHTRKTYMEHSGDEPDSAYTSTTGKMPPIDDQQPPEPKDRDDTYARSNYLAGIPGIGRFFRNDQHTATERTSKLHGTKAATGTAPISKGRMPSDRVESRSNAPAAAKPKVPPKIAAVFEKSTQNKKNREGLTSIQDPASKRKPTGRFSLKFSKEKPKKLF